MEGNEVFFRMYRAAVLIHRAIMNITQSLTDRSVHLLTENPFKDIIPNEIPETKGRRP